MYREDQFDKARDKFAAARDEFDKADAAKAAIAAFDEACASHRNGDVDRAREWYLKAGLAHDRRLAAAAHFNLGTLAAEEARRLAGEHPENVPADKRQAILDQLKGAVASFRHSLELQPDNARARRDIELVRQWIKYYTGKWYEHDRQKRRQETNLVAFLEFLIETQKALRESVKSLPATAPTDAFAELKRLQDELHDEIGPLKEKIKTDLQPKEPAGGNAPQATSQELEQGIAMLQGWADDGGEKMSSAERKLASRQATSAAADQQSAIDELEKIWDAVIPFSALLARDLADQTQIARTLEPAAASDSKREEDKPADETSTDSDDTKSAAPDESSRDVHQALSSESEDLFPLAEQQERTSRRTQLLKLKAEAELERLEKSPPSAATQPPEDDSEPADDDAGKAHPKPIDPEQLKAGFQKAIDLAPQAVEQMERAAKSLKQKDRESAYPPAEEARKILEEIQKAQPKQEQPEQKQGSGQRQERRRPREAGSEGSGKKGSAEKRGREERPGREGEGPEEVRRAEKARREETGPEAAADVEGSNRRCAAQGPRAATGKTGTGPQNEGPHVGQDSRGKGLVREKDR